VAKIRPIVSPKSTSKSSSTSIDRRTIHNEILLSLPSKELGTILPDLEFVEMRAYDLLNEMGEAIKICYFMNSGMTSILTVMGDGKGVEVGSPARKDSLACLSWSDSRRVRLGRSCRSRDLHFVWALCKCRKL